ncbi:MAG TPA: formate dehydrogenase accessory sulfurtransferase FdhD [Thermoanaerobaculia bacterium]|nr:formate dehydrogenase accessory sulfurtransferase FdhD [Thermoanaerobaculia bacterium]
MSSESTTREPVLRFTDGEPSEADDSVVVEEPLEIRIGERPVAVTMRTPGDDFDLAVGFLITEAIVARTGEIDAVRHWGSPNVVRVMLREGVTIDFERLRRHFYATSSCGICGKASIDAVRVRVRAVESDLRIDAGVVRSLPETLRKQQRAFAQTGAIHGAALFAPGGELVQAREDIGRHNAVDKAVGALLLAGTPMERMILAVSGRASFEIVQKALVAGIPAIVAVGGASSLAIDLAREFGMTLIGFARGASFNVYAGAQRVDRLTRSS